jgi:hypothetical protein
MQRTACCIVVMVSVAACSHPSSTTYGDSEVGQTIETTQGSVVSSRVVDVAGRARLRRRGRRRGGGRGGSSVDIATPGGSLELALWFAKLLGQ